MSENTPRKKMKKNEKNVSLYCHYVDVLDSDPLEEIFELNLGNFLTEHLMNEQLAGKIGKNMHDKNESLKKQLSELISIYSINNTLSVLGFNKEKEYIIYNSIAQTIKTMLNLRVCNIYLSQNDEPLALRGTSLKKGRAKIDEAVMRAYEKEKLVKVKNEKECTYIYPMKNNYECIGAIEVSRDIKQPLEKQYQELIEITARLFVTSLGLQKLIDEVQRVLNLDIVSSGELQNLRAQLTVVIGDLGWQQQSFVEIMAIAVDLKSKNKTNHSKQSAEVAKEICEHLELNEKTTDLIYYAALLQNIGQIQLKDEIFNKEKLTKKEWEELQNHPNAGVSLLMNINFLSEIIPYIHYQKERWDGKGTPEGLNGQSIPFGSRIIAVADAYCALREERPYRKALSKNMALKILREESGIKWDPDIIRALEEIVKAKKS